MGRRKPIKFICFHGSLMNFATLIDDIENVSKGSPKHFRAFYDGSSDYNLAYSTAPMTDQQIAKSFIYAMGLEGYEANNIRKMYGLPIKKVVEKGY